MKIPADEIIELLSSARKSALIVAPFVRSESLSPLLDSVPLNIETVVVTRWRPADLLAGVSDLDIYDVAEEKAVQLHLRNDLHAKMFAADDKCLVGSVNVTHTALGWRSPSNFELLTPVARTASHIVEFENALLVSCPRSSFNNFSDSGLFVLSGAKDLYVPNYQTVGAIFARWLSIKMTATATFLETFFCKELLGHDTSRGGASNRCTTRSSRRFDGGSKCFACGGIEKAGRGSNRRADASELDSTYQES